MREPDFVSFECNGWEVTQVTASYKRDLLRDYAIKYNLKTYVETGIYDGGTLLALHDLFDHAYAIEIDEGFYQAAASKFADWTNFTLINGDSAVELPKIISKLLGPTLFWIDAHNADFVGPVVAELSAIFASDVKGVVLVDDMDFIKDVLPSDLRWDETSEYGIDRFVRI